MCHLAMVVPIADAYYIAKNPQMAWKETEVMKKTAIQMKYNFQTLYKSEFYGESHDSRNRKQKKHTKI